MEFHSHTREIKSSTSQWVYITYFIQISFRVIIFTNQGGFKKTSKNYKTRREEFFNKIQLMAQDVYIMYYFQLEIPFIIICAIENDRYRKPRLGMWYYLIENENNDIEIGKVFVFDLQTTRKYSMQEMALVDKIIGRLATKKIILMLIGIYKHYQFYRKFALNLKIDFHTPEEYFLNEPKAEFLLIGFNPLGYLKLDLKIDKSLDFLNTKGLVLIIFIGFPASGKTKFFIDNMKSKEYQHINMVRI